MELTRAERRERVKSFHAHIAANAIPDTPICLSGPVRSQSADVPPAVEPVAEPEVPQEWVVRQKEIWFSIIDEIDPQPPRVTIGLIQRLCGGHYDFSLTQLLADCRQGPVVRARQVAIFLCKEFTTKSMPEIGRKFGDRDHTTVLHSIRKIRGLESSDNDLADDLVTLRKQIREAC